APHEHEPALGLRLERPRVGEGPPPGLELAQAEGIAGDGDAVLVHLQPRRLVHDRRDFDRGAAVEVPGAERRAVPELVLALPASATVAANGFSMRMWTPNGATFSVHSAWRAVAGQRITTSGLVRSRHSR